MFSAGLFPRPQMLPLFSTRCQCCLTLTLAQISVSRLFGLNPTTFNFFEKICSLFLSLTQPFVYTHTGLGYQNVFCDRF